MIQITRNVITAACSAYNHDYEHMAQQVKSEMRIRMRYALVQANAQAELNRIAEQQ